MHEATRCASFEVLRFICCDLLCECSGAECVLKLIEDIDRSSICQLLNI